MSVEEKTSPATSTAAPVAKREVRSSPESKKITEAGAKPTRKTVHNPRKVGKGNLKRDIPIFLGIIFFLVLQAYWWNDVGKPDDKKDKKKTLQDMQKVLRKQLEESHARELARKRTIECNLFLATSSIPGAGLGIFTGKRFEAGDEVMHPGLFFPVFNGNGGSVDIRVSQYGLLLKHHPLLANLQGGPTWSEERDLDGTNVISLKAARAIEPGEELFLRLENHPERVLGEGSDLFSIPSLADYGMADDIVRQEVVSMKPHQKFDTVAGRGSPMKRSGSGEALLLTKKAVEIVNQQVAALLPISMKELERRSLFGSTAPFSAMRNLTISNLESNGQCLDDVQVKQSAVRSTQIGLFAQRPIGKGRVVVPAPLYAMLREKTCAASDEACATGDTAYLRHCFGHQHSILALCPLSAAAFIQTLSGDKVNAAVEWSSRINIKKFHKLSVDELSETHALSLGVDIVALRDIQPGEEIIIDAVREGDTEDGLIELGGVIYSDTWKFS